MPLDSLFWTFYMQLYDRGVASLRPYLHLHEEVIRLLNPAPGSTVIDAGCGTGELIRKMNAADPTLTIIGLERAESAHAIASDKFESVRNVSIRSADLNKSGWELDLPKVDAIASVNVLYTLSDPDMFLAAAHSLLRQGGRLVLANPYVPKPQLVLKAHEAWLQNDATSKEREHDRVHLAWTRRIVLTMNNILAEHAEAEELHFWPPEKLRLALERHGFAVHHVDPDAYTGTCVLVMASV